MSDFRTKLLGLAAVSMTFAGLSYGQVTCTGPVAGAASASTNVSPLLLRAEGETELVSDIIVQCSGSTAVASGQVSLFASLPVTSKAVANVAPANSEVVLELWDVLCGQGAQAACPAAPDEIALGAVANGTVTFPAISFPAGTFTLQVSNVRVNASAAGATTAPIPVGETIFIGTNGVASVAFTNVTVGYVLKSLVAPAFVLSPVTNFPNVSQYLVCTGNPLVNFPLPIGSTFNPIAGGVGNVVSFAATVAESFGGAFKVQGAVVAGRTSTATLANQEEGSYVGAADGVLATVGTASSGTEIQFTLGNVPTSATVYVPIQIVNGTLTLTLTGNPTAVTSPTQFAAGTIIPAAYPMGLTTATPTNNTVTLTYQVTASNASVIESANVPFGITFAPNSAPVQTAITVLEQYAPSAALLGQASSVPTFAPATNAPLNASAINLCQTTLLFPFVSTMNSAGGGFDTGMAITNATTDNLAGGAVPGTVSGTKSAATATPGSCVLNFYGAQTQPAAFITSVGNASTGGIAPVTLGAWSATATPSPNPTFAATLSSMISPVTSFTGYAIASCNFLDAHGFAFLTYDSAGPNGLADGYLAVVIPNLNGASVGQ
jgi:hypothetical protein